jgi:hypothetical protein
LPKQKMRVLEEAADDRLDADIVGKARHLRTQAADAAHDEVDSTPAWLAR